MNDERFIFNESYLLFMFYNKSDYETNKQQTNNLNQKTKETHAH